MRVCNSLVSFEYKNTYGNKIKPKLNSQAQIFHFQFHRLIRVNVNRRMKFD